MMHCCCCDVDYELGDVGASGVSRADGTRRITDAYSSGNGITIYFWRCDMCDDPVYVCSSCISKNNYLCLMCKRGMKIEEILK